MRRSKEALATPIIQLAVPGSAESYTVRRSIDTGKVRTAATFDAPYHFHPEVELILVETSSGTRYIADSAEHYQPGDLVLIGANVPHVFKRETTGPAACLVAQFRMDFMGEAFFKRPEMHTVNNLIERSNAGLIFNKKTVRWAAPLLEKMLEQQGAARFAALISLLGQLADAPARPLASAAFCKKIRDEDFARLDKVLAYTKSRYQENITVADVAKLVSLTPTSFSRWFSQATSKSFVDFLTSLRMMHAYRMLTETSKTITEIAYSCGYNSVSHFNHRFHAIRGFSPTEFKRRIGSGLFVD